ncbi:TPA: Eaa protein [Salmonella enterica subsp. enterica serovar Bredeney]
MELARIALASLEVAPVGEVSEKRCGLVMDGTVDLDGKSTYRIIKGEKAMKRLPLGTKFYIAPPAPVVDADPVVFTDERNLHHIAMGRETSLIWGKQNQEVGDIPLYRHAQPVPVDKEFIPKNLDKALGVVGVALPESKEEFNFQTERWIQRLIDRVIRYADEFKEQPVPVVPDEMATSDDMNLYQKSFAQGYNACRAAMLQGVEQPQNARQNIPENIPDGNSPAIPDDWVMVPKEPTQAMIKAWLSEVANWRGHVAGYKAALAAAPQHEVK